MATYKAIHGIKVQYRDSDATAVEGDVWYNASFGKLKMYMSEGAWASGGNINSPRDKLGGAGTQTAGLVFGGENPTSAVESYDGSSWTEIADLGTGRYMITGTGTQTAAIAVNGDPGPSNTVEQWNGASWTEVGDLNTSRKMGGCMGTSTAALYAGGKHPAKTEV